MPEPAFEPLQPESLELPVEELLKRAQPMPPFSELAIDDLTEEEGEAFLADLTRP